MATRNEFITEARKYIGVPYKWGGNTPKGFDCSGLVQYCLSQFNINIGRTTYDMIKNVKQVSKLESINGDLIFYMDKNNSPYHVCIKTDKGLIESPNENLKVREIPIYNGNIVYGRITQLTDEVIKTDKEIFYRVLVGSFKDKNNAEIQKQKLKEDGYDCKIMIYEK